MPNADEVRIAELERRVAGPPESQHARVEAYLELGRAYRAAGRLRDARGCFRRVLALTDDWRHREQARRLYKSGP